MLTGTHLHWLRGWWCRCVEAYDDICGRRREEHTFQSNAEWCWGRWEATWWSLTPTLWVAGCVGEGTAAITYTSVQLLWNLFSGFLLVLWNTASCISLFIIRLVSDALALDGCTRLNTLAGGLWGAWFHAISKRFIDWCSC